MSENHFRKLTTLLKKLEQARIHYTLGSYREDAIMVLVTVPGARWEIEFLSDGTVEVERFLSTGEICGEEALGELLGKYSDPERAEAI
jgi:hypothetical protein